ncbi:MAG: hypothetical protein HDR90_10925 [Bacteroides sp.]|nr:hypothetical protein [Bacteroides sp.]
MEIPTKVKEAAQYLIDIYGDHVEHLGQYQGAEAFYYRFPEDVDAGFPVVYLLKGNELTEVSDFFALEIIGSFIENVDEIGIE